MIILPGTVRRQAVLLAGAARKAHLGCQLDVVLMSCYNIAARARS